jgi:hypothetical protein
MLRKEHVLTVEYDDERMGQSRINRLLTKEHNKQAGRKEKEAYRVRWVFGTRQIPVDQSKHDTAGHTRKDDETIPFGNQDKWEWRGIPGSGGGRGGRVEFC